MIDKNIKRFCELVPQINKMNRDLDKARDNFYDGGYSFEDCYEHVIKDLVELQNEFKEVLKDIQNN